MRKLLLALFFLILVDSSFAATVHGTVYDDNLDVLKDVVVEVDSVPNQRFVAKDGVYSFTLPPRSYILTVKHDNQIIEEKIIIEKEGDYVLDLFSFPSFEEEDELLKETGEIAIEDGYFKEDRTSLYVIISVAVLVLLGVIFYFLKSRKPEIKSGIEDIKEEYESEKYLGFIKGHGGRTTQKEIRKNFPVSEAKVSLIITELEHSGKIEKIKKGRNNIIVLKK